MLTGLFFGFASGVIGSRLWRPLMAWYLRQEKEVAETLEGKRRA